MAGRLRAKGRCPRCGYVNPSNDDFAADAFFRPWHVMHGKAGVRAYVASLGYEALEWLLALYVDEQLQLLAVDTVAQGSVSDCKVPFWKLINRGHQLSAAGYILVHNHPSGDPRPSRSDVTLTHRLDHLSTDADMPLLNHLIIAGDQMWVIK